MIAALLNEHDLVVNVVVLNDDENLAVAATNLGCAVALDVTNTSPRPGPGWTLLGNAEWRPPAPFASWVWVEGSWAAPTPMPTEGGPWLWDEDTTSWIESSI